MSRNKQYLEQKQREWTEIVKQYESSEMEIPAYCETKGVTPWSLKYWIKKLKGRPQPKSAARLIPVEVIPPEPKEAEKVEPAIQCQIKTKTGHQIDIHTLDGLRLVLETAL